jgi:hypothetical protein
MDSINLNQIRPNSAFTQGTTHKLAPLVSKPTNLSSNVFDIGKFLLPQLSTPSVSTSSAQIGLCSVLSNAANAIAKLTIPANVQTPFINSSNQLITAEQLLNLPLNTFTNNFRISNQVGFLNSILAKSQQVIRELPITIESAFSSASHSLNIMDNCYAAGAAQSTIPANQLPLSMANFFGDYRLSTKYKSTTNWGYTQLRQEYKQTKSKETDSKPSLFDTASKIWHSVISKVYDWLSNFLN